MSKWWGLFLINIIWVNSAAMYLHTFRLTDNEKQQYKAIREAIFEIDPSFKQRFNKQYPHLITLNSIQSLAKHPKISFDIEVRHEKAQAIINNKVYPVTGNLARIIESYFDDIQPGI